MFFLVKEFLGSTKRCWLDVSLHMLSSLQLANNWKTSHFSPDIEEINLGDFLLSITN